MRIHIFDEDLTLSELATRVFGKKPKKQQPELVERLMTANPQLAGMETVARGTPIVALDPASPDPRLAAAVERARQMIDDVAVQRNEAHDDAQRDIEARLALIKSIGPRLPKEAKKPVDDVNNDTLSQKRILDQLRRDDAEARDELNKRAGNAVPSAAPLPVSGG